MSVTFDTTIGCILGTAVGDAMGLPYEGLRPPKIRSVAGYHLIWGKGMVSDDTDTNLRSKM
jgi:ADP-ribosylglycohydrolase